jgi:hypothetical protein
MIWNINGKTIKKEVRFHYFPMKQTSKSDFQHKIGEILKIIYPNYQIVEDFPIPEGGGLSLDFFIPRLKVALECNGNQHNTFSKFFHCNQEGFAAAKKRDVLKETICRDSNILLIVIPYSKEILESDIRKKIAGG